MPLALQSRLLRVLEEREIVRVGGVRPIPINVRIISATHCDLEQRIREGKFRADLFYRLAVLRRRLPTLRERPEDCVLLAQWCLKQALAALGSRVHPNLHAEVTRCAPVLQNYAWPGNVRELRNAMERIALALSVNPLQAITPQFMRKNVPELEEGKTIVDITPIVLPANTNTNANEELHALMEQFQGNRDNVAKHLGISRTTLWRRLKAL